MTTDRRAANKAKLRAEILEAARAILVRDGYENFSMRELAHHIGYTPAAVYKHFESKGEIFSQLAEASFAALIESSKNVKEFKGEDPVARLKRGMGAYVKFGLQNPDHYRIAFLLHQPARSTPPKPRAAYAGLTARVQNCIDAGKFEDGDLELKAQSLWAALHGITSLLIQKPEFPWVARDKLISQVIESAVAGLFIPCGTTTPRNGRLTKRKELTDVSI